MLTIKTTQNDSSVQDFLETLAESRRKDALALLGIMQEITGFEPKMWGPSIVGFGVRQLKYASGRELEWMLVGFSPRKQDFSLYLTGSLEAYQTHLQQLGKHKAGKGCLYIKRLEDVSIAVLRSLIKDAAQSAHTTAN
jgi:hypothetical protein